MVIAEMQSFLNFKKYLYTLFSFIVNQDRLNESNNTKRKIKVYNANFQHIFIVYESTFETQL